jgi:hypothetical protein
VGGLEARYLLAQIGERRQRRRVGVGVHRVHGAVGVEGAAGLGVPNVRVGRGRGHERGKAVVDKRPWRGEGVSIVCV